MKHCISPGLAMRALVCCMALMHRSLMSAAISADWLHGAGAWLKSSLLYEAVLAPEADCRRVEALWRSPLNCRSHVATVKAPHGRLLHIGRLADTHLLQNAMLTVRGQAPGLLCSWSSGQGALWETTAHSQKCSKIFSCLEVSSTCAVRLRSCAAKESNAAVNFGFLHLCKTRVMHVDRTFCICRFWPDAVPDDHVGVASHQDDVARYVAKVVCLCHIPALEVCGLAVVWIVHGYIVQTRVKRTASASVLHSLHGETSSEASLPTHGGECCMLSQAGDT